MPPVQAIPATGTLGRRDQVCPVVEMGKRNGAISSAEVPCTAEIILRACTRYRWLGILINENHLITFAHPVLAILQNAKSDTHQMACALCFHENVVILAIRVPFRLWTWITNRRIGR